MTLASLCCDSWFVLDLCGASQLSDEVIRNMVCRMKHLQVCGHEPEDLA